VSKSTVAAEYIAISTASDDRMLLLKLFDDLQIAVRPHDQIIDLGVIGIVLTIAKCKENTQ
jgi:hypothetical protein